MGKKHFTKNEEEIKYTKWVAKTFFKDIKQKRC